MGSLKRQSRVYWLHQCEDRGIVMRTAAKTPAAEALCEQRSVGADGAGGEGGGARLQGGAEGGLRGALRARRRADCAGWLQRQFHGICRNSQACQ